MSGSRLVEYFVVAGVGKDQFGRDGEGGGGGREGDGVTSPVSPMSPLSEHTSRELNLLAAPKAPPDVKVVGSVIQRFPAADRKEAALPAGIEIFCQPLGWMLTYNPKAPTFVDFVLTAEDSSRLYCTTLNFYELCKQCSPGGKNNVKKGTSGKSKSKELRKNKSDSSVKVKVDYLDEGHEESWTVKDVYGELYQPVSLCMVSRSPMFDIFQLCLKGLYIQWVGSDSTHKLEQLIGEMLGNLHLPPVNCVPVKRSFGALKELVLPPIREDISLPYTSTCALWLLRRIGIHQLLQLVSSIISDYSVLFISSSLTCLNSALRALCSIIHPFRVTHAIVPVVPADLLDYTQLPSTYLMGVHSSLREQIDIEMIEVVEVYLDSGSVQIPETLQLPYLPIDVIPHVQQALSRVLDETFDDRDCVFRKSLPLPLGVSGRSEELLDKEVRAIFLCLMATLLGDYQKFISVLRFQPNPTFYFNMEAYRAEKECGNDPQSLVYKMSESISFFNFCHERSVPYRQCDFFDDLVARFACNPQDLQPSRLFSWMNILELAEEIHHLLPPCHPQGGPEFNTEGVTPEALASPLKHFPLLKEEEIAQMLSQHSEDVDYPEEIVQKRKIPLLDSTPSHTRQSSLHKRGLDSLCDCLDAMFQGKIIEARKYVPSVTQALKSGILSEDLVPALVDCFLQYGVLLSSEQFDLVVKLLNSALVDQQSAMTLLPLMTVIYREVNPGVVQYAFTCVQNHYIWEKLTFWRDATYLAIQAELVRVYAEVEAEYRRKEKKKMELDLAEAEDLTEESADIGDITLRSRQRLRSTSPARLRARASKVFMTRSARMRMRASVVVPGVSEGVLPPNAKPVTAQEALHHLSKILDIWPTLPEEKQANMITVEENAIENQLLLFVQRVISLRIPVELPEDEEEQYQFTSELEQFIDQLLRMVEVDLGVNLTKIKFRDQIHDMILIHLDSMAGLRKELKRLPIAKPKMIKPPLIPGEVLLMEHGVHAYLLQDGRDNGLMLPADGQIFLTSYRIIFLGTPCDPQAPSLIVTRSMPVSSIYRLKKLNPTPLPPPVAISTVGGLQIRSATAELLKIGFDDETSPMDIKNLDQHLVNLRNPSTITLGVRLHSPPPDTRVTPDRDNTCSVTHSLSPLNRQQLKNKNKNENRTKGGNVLSHSNTLTRVKILSEISQSPCCLEYSRLKLGSVNFQDTKKGVWRTTTLNLAYAVCSSYPAVLVVPSKVTDESLAILASQFQHSRWPVVTWKHPKKDAVLLRSSSFIPSSITKKKFIARRFPTPAQKHLAGEEALLNKAGVGVYNKDVETYFYDLLLVNPTNHPSLDLVQQISMPPPIMEFEEELKRQGSFRGAPPSPSPSSESADFDVEMSKANSGFGIRNRAATYAFKIRTRVGSSVSQLSRIALPDKKPLGSPSARQKFLTKRKMFSSPQLPRKSTSDDSMSRNSSCSTVSDLSMDKMKWREESLREEPESTEVEDKKSHAKSANTSPVSSKRPSHKRTRSSDEVIDLKAVGIELKDIVVSERTSPEPPVSPIDWEAVGSERSNEREEVFGRPSTSTTEDDGRTSSPDLLASDHHSRNTFNLQWEHSKRDTKTATLSPGSFSTLPTNPRDWLVMDALPTELNRWQANALYILGDQDVLQDIPDDLYPNCMFVPIEVPSLGEVSNSFTKLMRACIPSSPQATFLAAVQDSGWMMQLTHLMQLGGAVADLMDIQGSSVLVCLENGWDATAQVVSIAQLLLDPYYRTMEGFKMLVEKDWLSFGHRFSYNGSHTSATNISSFTPIFLQFLDVVHQILKQFPLSFEFNDFFLSTVAYHHCSMRFHTFTADSEKERYANNWLPYRPRTANIYGSSGHSEEFSSFWSYVEGIHKESMLFYNFRYQPPLDLEDQAPLRPYSYQANMDIWSFYLDNNLSQFPFYDTELISEGPLTLLDMHHNFFEREKSLPLTGFRIVQPSSVASEISSLLWQYTRLMNTLAERHSLPHATWMELLEELLTSSPTENFPVFPSGDARHSHGLTLHKRTTLAVLIKGKLAVELEAQFTTPHQFEPLERGRGQHECGFCKLQVNRREEGEIFKCKKCGCVCHGHCKAQMPHNCGQEKLLKRKLSKRKIGGAHDGPERSHWNRHASSIFFHKDTQDLPDGQQISEGYLYKRGKIVKNWKLRWFILDTEKGELSYYDSKADSKCHGTINLRDILALEEAEPQVVPALKPGEPSFFFNLVTQKRVFHLMALRDVERTEWIQTIRRAAQLNNPSPGPNRAAVN